MNNREKRFCPNCGSSSIVSWPGVLTLVTDLARKEEAANREVITARWHRCQVCNYAAIDPAELRLPENHPVGHKPIERDTNDRTNNQVFVMPWQERGGNDAPKIVRTSPKTIARKKRKSQRGR